MLEKKYSALAKFQHTHTRTVNQSVSQCFTTYYFKTFKRLNTYLNLFALIFFEILQFI